MPGPASYSGFQITFDAQDPIRLADFWALALGYQVEPPPDGFASWPDALRAWGVPEDRWGSASAIIDPAGLGPRVFFQQVPEGKTAKNRVHLDVRAARGRQLSAEEQTQARQEQVETLKAAGATEGERYDEMGSAWVVLFDIEGNEFCVS